LGSRFDAPERNATWRPSADMAGNSLGPSAGPYAPKLAIDVIPCVESPNTRFPLPRISFTSRVGAPTWK
jgi:hypothetical protein